MAAKKVKLISTESKKKLVVSEEVAANIFKLQENRTHKQSDYWILDDTKRADKGTDKKSKE